MKYLLYKNNKNCEEIFIENVALSQIEKEVGTPFYCYSKKSLIENFTSFGNAFLKEKISNYKICYAIKANFNLHLVKILASMGCGIDAVSAGEVFYAIKAGIDPKKIVFAGVGKSEEEMKYAIENGVEEFSVESEAEMFMLNKIALSINKKVKFSLRVNPNIDAKTHDKISTGRKGDKFGVEIEKAEEVYRLAENLKGLEVYGIAMHIGSQITSIEPFKNAFTKLRDLCITLRKNGHKISSLDFGGGIGILYKDENTLLIDDYINLIKNLTKDLEVKIVIAPGRAIVGTVGLLVSKVILLKQTSKKNYAIIDTAMNDLMRPGLYSAYHEVLPVVKKNGVSEIYDLAGPVCETTDILAKDRKLSELKAGDLLAFLSAGAYGSSMSNEYNCRPLIPEVLIDGSEFKIIRKRPSFEEMLKLYY
jgi:diaminopimelate decarboxylase